MTDQPSPAPCIARLLHVVQFILGDAARMLGSWPAPAIRLRHSQRWCLHPCGFAFAAHSFGTVGLPTRNLCVESAVNYPSRGSERIGSVRSELTWVSTGGRALRRRALWAPVDARFSGYRDLGRSLRDTQRYLGSLWIGGGRCPWLGCALLQGNLCARTVGRYGACTSIRASSSHFCFPVARGLGRGTIGRYTWVGP